MITPSSGRFSSLVGTETCESCLSEYPSELIYGICPSCFCFYVPFVMQGTDVFAIRILLAQQAGDAIEAFGLNFGFAIHQF